ncbi:hypothetical protein RQP46_004367 [Phenoliferia psychrophenolica]
MSKRPRAPDADAALATAGSGPSLVASTSSPPRKKSPKLENAFTALGAAAKTKDSFWRARAAPNCPHGVYGEPKGSAKVAAFDLDGTLIKVASGAKFAKDKDDWTWLYPEIPSVLKQLVADGYSLVLLSNQAGASAQQKKFLDKIPLIALSLKVPFHAFAAFQRDEYRKPSTAMWDSYVADFNDGVVVDLKESFYVGDAAGRSRTANTDADHSDCDRKLALNIGLPFKTPEEFFKKKHQALPTPSGWDSSKHDHSVPLFSPTSTPLVPKYSEFTKAPPDIVLFIGYPAAGKTTLFEKYFRPANYVHINQDTLKTRPACLALLRASLSSNPPRSCVIDNTNPAESTRAEYLSLVRNEFPSLGARVRAFVFDASLDVAKHNSVHRAVQTRGLSKSEGRRDVLPIIAFTMFKNGLQDVKASEGFDEIKHIAFKIEDEEERKRWTKWYGGVYPDVKPAKAKK